MGLLKTGVCFTQELKLPANKVEIAKTFVDCAGSAHIPGDAIPSCNAMAVAITASQQTLSLAGQTLTLSGGGSTPSSVLVPGVGAQALSIAGNVLSISNGNNVTLPAAAVPFATPAETIAGVDTGKALDPADLTAKLANQPSAGSCTDRDEVVWNGAILQGAAKHYSIPRTVLWLTTPPTILDGTFTDSVDISITNPSNCRTLRLTFDDVSGYFYTPSMTPGLGNFIFGVFTTFGTGMQGFAPTTTDTSGKFLSVANKGFFATAGYVDIPPGATTTVQFSVNNGVIIPQTLNAGGVEFYFTAAFTGQTI
jgi:hypothetical protein